MLKKLIVLACTAALTFSVASVFAQSDASPQTLYGIDPANAHVYAQPKGWNAPGVTISVWRSWEPLTATSEELAKHNYPARPTDPGKLKEWESNAAGPGFEMTPGDGRVGSTTHDEWLQEQAVLR